jgi:hypothetical protein
MRAQISTFLRLMEDHGMLEGIREALRRLDSGTKIRRSLFERRHGPGMLHSRRDWDNMVILDACRFDIFRDHSTLEGQLESMISVGDYTWEWMEQNWRGGVP